MKKCIKTNLYAAVDKMVIITLLLLVAAIASKKMLGLAIATVSVGSAMLAAQVLFGKAKIENESGETIYTKGEEDCDATELLPGNSRYGIDGVKNQGHVYKLCDGCHAVAHKDGTMEVKSVTGKIINRIFSGGNMDCWDELFKA